MYRVHSFDFITTNCRLIAFVQERCTDLVKTNVAGVEQLRIPVRIAIYLVPQKNEDGNKSEPKGKVTVNNGGFVLNGLNEEACRKAEEANK